MIASTVIGFGIALVVAWSALALLVYRLRAPGQSVRDVARVVPDSLRLVTALYRDAALPNSIRWRLRVALIYNLQPVNLIPDVIPVVGFADNVAVLAWALRGTVRRAGHDAVERHWRGSPECLATLYRLLRVPPDGR